MIKPPQMELLLALVILAVLLGSVWGWTLALSRLAGGQPILPLESRRQVPWGLLDVFIALGLFFGLQVAGLVLVRALYGIDVAGGLERLAPEERAAVLLAGSLATLLTMVLSLLIVRMRTATGWADVGLVPAKILHDLGLGLAGFVMLAPLVYAIQWVLVQLVPTRHPLIVLLKEHPDPLFFLLSGFAAVLVAPVVEEYLFRVLLQGWLEKVAAFAGNTSDLVLGERTPGERPPGVPDPPERGPLEEAKAIGSHTAGEPPSLNPYAAPHEGGFEPHRRWLAAADVPAGQRLPFWPILVSSAVFALMHMGHGPDPIPLFFLALGLGYLYQRTHRILPCILVHLLLNASSLLALLVEVYAGRG